MDSKCLTKKQFAWHMEMMLFRKGAGVNEKLKWLEQREHIASCKSCLEVKKKALEIARETNHSRSLFFSKFNSFLENEAWNAQEEEIAETKVIGILNLAKQRIEDWRSSLKYVVTPSFAPAMLGDDSDTDARDDIKLRFEEADGDNLKVIIRFNPETVESFRLVTESGKVVEPNLEKAKDGCIIYNSLPNESFGIEVLNTEPRE